MKKMQIFNERRYQMSELTQLDINRLEKKVDELAHDTAEVNNQINHINT